VSSVRQLGANRKHQASLKQITKGKAESKTVRNKLSLLVTHHCIDWKGMSNHVSEDKVRFLVCSDELLTVNTIQIKKGG